MAIDIHWILSVAILTTPFFFEKWAKRSPRTIQSINHVCAVLTVFYLGLILVVTDSLTQTNAAKGAFSLPPILASSALLSLIWIYQVRSKLIGIARGIKLRQGEKLLTQARMILGIVLIYSLYYLISTWVGKHFSIWLGIPLAMIALIYVTPIILQVMWKTTPIQNPETINLIQDCFARADVDLKRFYFIHLQKLKFHNAMVCGPRFGFGPFRRSLFITPSLFDHLSLDETKAVLLHEAAHFKLHHLPKRMGAAGLGILLALLMIVIIGTVTFTLFKSPMSALVELALFLLIQAPFVGTIARRHEFEADLMAVQLGASGPALVSALQKITALSGIPQSERPSFFTRVIFGVIHPTLDERAMVLAQGYIASKSLAQPLKQYALTFTLILATQLSVSYLNLQTKYPHPAIRNIASTPSQR